MAEKKQAAKKDDRTRDYACLVYPTQEEYESYYAEHSTIINEDGTIESVPKYDGSDGWGSHPVNWLEIIAESHNAICISPMHYRDTNPDGKIKKPHWHILVMYDGKKNFETQVKPFFDSFGGVGREEVGSKRGYARYLKHLDNPEKAQYNQKFDVVRCFGGADWDLLIHLPTDDIRALFDLFHYIRQNQILSYADLIDSLIFNEEKDLFVIATMKYTYSISKYLKSCGWEISGKYETLRKKQKKLAEKIEKEDAERLDKLENDLAEEEQKYNS